MKINKWIIACLLIWICAAPMHAEKYKIEIGQFEKLKITGNISVVYKNLPDSTGMAFYNAPAGNNDIFDISLKKNGVLKIQPSDAKWGNNDLPVIYLYSDYLSSVESFSEKTVELSNLAPCSSLSITLVGNGSIYADQIKATSVSASISTGNGSIYLSGSCDNAHFRMVGTGLISADQLISENVSCSILGTGSIGCRPIDNLKVTGLGSTKIYYKGSPNIVKKGGGKLFQLPEETVPQKGAEVRSFNLEGEDE